MFYKKMLTTTFRSCVSITAEVNELLEQSGVKNGLCVISVPHTTAGLAITSFWDERGLFDLLDEIDRNLPTRVSYKHQDSPYDASGHVKSAIFNSKVTLAIYEGTLVLGSSQGLVFCEYDGPRPREFWVEIVEMPVQLKKIDIQTEYMGMHDISSLVQQAVESSGVANGVCHVSVLHSTAGLVTASRSSKASQGDAMEDFERMVPTRVDFKHRETASDAGGHVKTAFTGTQLTFVIQEGTLDLGSDQGIIFAEFDGPRPRSFYVAVLADFSEWRNLTHE